MEQWHWKVENSLLCFIVPALCQSTAQLAKHDLTHFLAVS